VNSPKWQEGCSKISQAAVSWPPCEGREEKKADEIPSTTQQIKSICLNKKKTLAGEPKGNNRGGFHQQGQKREIGCKSHGSRQNARKFQVGHPGVAQKRGYNPAKWRGGESCYPLTGAPRQRVVHRERLAQQARLPDRQKKAGEVDTGQTGYLEGRVVEGVLSEGRMCKTPA